MKCILETAKKFSTQHPDNIFHSANLVKKDRTPTYLLWINICKRKLFYEQLSRKSKIVFMNEFQRIINQFIHKHIILNIRNFLPVFFNQGLQEW